VYMNAQSLHRTRIALRSFEIEKKQRGFSHNAWALC
jgi:hypothetical protein